MSARVDEEALADGVDADERKTHGIFFTPGELVARVLEAAARWAGDGPLAIVDPACGAGAFLAAAAERFSHASLFGADLLELNAATCRRRVPSATIVTGDALADDALQPLLRAIPEGTTELWVGNPPYNGTSPLLQRPEVYERVRGWMPPHLTLPRGTSLRDDYVFFLLRASLRLEKRRGVLAFVTSSTLLDTYLYAPVRQALLERMTLREAVDLGPGIFKGARVRTCFTVWTSPRTNARVPAVSGEAESFVPAPPEWRLRPTTDDAEALHTQWAQLGEPLTSVLPVSFPGLKTRFDELLVDDDQVRLLARVTEFCAAPASELEAFARKHELPPRHLAKLRALHRTAHALTPREANVRPFLQYRGPQPRGPTRFCYLDRALIPRGDHRLRGDYDPHLGAIKLAFNVHELPLSATVFEEPGCVTAYRHSRFAPLLVPRRLREEGLAAARLCTPRELEELVPNLSPRGLQTAAQLGGPRQLFEAIAAFVTSSDVQLRWGPAFGTARVLPIPLDSLSRPAP